MGLKEWLKQLIDDAKAVWAAPGANRPLTRRWMIDKELSKRNKQKKTAEQADSENKPDKTED